MDFSLSQCCLFIPEGTFSASTRGVNAIYFSLNLAAQRAVVQPCIRMRHKEQLKYYPHFKIKPPGPD
ncbi:MAG: hypothetical protein CMQ45_06420 [Gammaproteobacteria bacterium]|nr:hypothetical protein [Gammaproteobacteria bacterium]